MADQIVSVDLDYNITYVTGTVNDAPTEWQRVYGSTWEAAVPRDEKGVYHIVITGYDVLGRSSTIDTTLHYGLFLITDRTEADLINETYKGKYDYEDFNRVATAQKYLADLLDIYGYDVKVYAKNTWLSADEPTYVDFATYLQDTQKLRDMLTMPQGTPEVPPDLRFLTYTEANDIERILQTIYILLGRLVQSWYYSDEIFSGEV